MMCHEEIRRHIDIALYTGTQLGTISYKTFKWALINASPNGKYPKLILS